MKETASTNSLLSSKGILSLLSLLLLALVVFCTLRAHRPPAPVPATSPRTEFSSERALGYLRQFAWEPHPVNSPAHERVRDYIYGELARQGLQPEIQSAVVESESVNQETLQRVGQVRVQNIYARLKGTGEDGAALLLCAHYDSVGEGPGASDDGAGVATLLETLAAIKAGEPLRHDLIFLFTDGEELGLLGAQAFVKENSLAKNVKLVLNFEARGTCGPVYMFETGEINGDLIKEFARSAPLPFASSLMFTVYKTLPNDTDMSVFKAAGLNGLNFAFIGCAANYHSRSDNIETIAEGSLQHMGLNALALARRFGNSSLDLKGGRAVYFDLFGKMLVEYPQGWVLPLCLFNVLVFALVLFYGLRTGLLTIRGMGLGAFGFLISLICATLVISLLAQVLASGGNVHDASININFLALCFASVAFIITLAIALLLSRWTSAANLCAGFLLWWLMLLAIFSFASQGISYLFNWPTLLGLCALFILLLAERRAIHTLLSWLALAILTLPCVALLTWTTEGILQGVGLRLPLVLSLPVVLASGLLLPFLDFRSTRLRFGQHKDAR